MKFAPYAMTFLVAGNLAACSTILEGTSQTITFNSNPPGANCVLSREGLTIGNVTTPGGLVIKKTKHNIQVLCSKPGFDDSTMVLKSGTAGATYGNLVVGGLIGLGIDSASGADNKYDEVVNVFLNRKIDARVIDQNQTTAQSTQ
jgi:hypothetical protein